MFSIHKLAVALVAVLFIRTGIAPAQEISPRIQTAQYEQRYSLTGGAWIRADLDDGGRLHGLGFREDGYFVLAMFDGSSGDVVLKKEGSFSLYEERLTIVLDGQVFKTNIVWLGADHMSTLDDDGRIHFWKRVR